MKKKNTLVYEWNKKNENKILPCLVIGKIYNFVFKYHYRHIKLEIYMISDD